VTGSIARVALPTLAVVVVLGHARVARGGGTEVADNGGEAMGRGGAFVAKADNPATINYNPAGFAKLRGYQATISANVVHAGIDFQRSGRTPFANADGAETPYPLIENSQPWFAAPMHLMLTADFGVRWLTVAAGLYVPSAVGASYPAATKIDGRDVAAPQRFMLANTEGNSQLLMFPSVAIGLRLHEKIDIGLSFQTAIYKINFTQIATVGAACETPEDPGCDVTINLDVKDLFSPTGSAGVLLRPFRGLELGAMVRLPSHAEMTGKAKAVFGPNVSKLNPHVTAPLLDPTEPSVSVTNDYPWMFRLGARYVFYRGDEEKADIEVDFTYERWSAVSERTVKIDGKSLGKPMDPVSMDMRLADTYGVRIGGSYLIRLARDLDLTLRAGVFGESETNDVSATNLQFLGPRRIGVAGGLGLRWGWVRADVAYAHLFLPERIVNNSTVTATDFGSKVPGPVVGNGVYNARVDALYVQLTATYGAAARAPRRVEEPEPPAAAKPARREQKVDDLGFEVSDDPAKRPRPGALQFDPEELSRSTGAAASQPEVVAPESPRAPRLAPRKAGHAGKWKAYRSGKLKSAVKHRRAVRSKGVRCRARDASGRCVRISLQMR
jgi:long-chain fatty acid transport protein